MPYITKAGLKQLDNYKYVGGAYSWLDNKMNPFWEWSVRLLPEWMAPNLVTFIGWVFVILSYAVMLYYDYTFTKIIPSQTFYFAAACIFIYQTLDAIDGKQARRTKSSSPLGQLFDHGCDSFSMSFFVLAACQAVRMERDDIFFVFMAAQVAWWSSNWMEYHTGILTTSVGNFGVTQTELICCAIHILTGLFGQQMWDIKIGDFLTAKKLIAYFVAVTLLGLCIYTYINLLVKSPGKRFLMVKQVVSIILVLGIEFVWMNTSLYDKYNGIILLNFGILMSLLVCKMIVCSVTKMEMQAYHNEINVFLLATLLLLHFDRQSNLQYMIYTFWGCFLVNIMETFVFLARTITEITDYLGIYCFSLKKKQRKLLD